MILRRFMQGAPWSRRPESRWLSGFFMALLVVASAAHSEMVPAGSWVYDALRSFELRGLVRLEPTLPYSFDAVEAYTNEIRENVNRGNVALGPRHAFLLKRLIEQFIRLRDRPEDRYDEPVFLYRDGDRYGSFDMVVGGSGRKKVDDKKGEAEGLAVPGVTVGFGNQLTMEAEYRLVLAPERGSNVGDAKASARLRSYRGLTAECERALLDASGGWWDVRIGREYVQWGSNMREGLLISRTAGSLDHVGARFALGPFALSTVQASLDSGSRRHLAGHRLTVALPRGIWVGIGEAVVYARNLDFTYLIPLGSYYALQYSEKSNDDNILCAVDWKVPLRRGLMVSGEFLMDDIQYERDELAGPDRIGLNLAVDALCFVGGRELELSGEYTYLDIYTYAHSMSTMYVAGDGDRSMNPILGSTLGPDADEWRCKASLGASARTAIAAEGIFTRRGEGNAAVGDHLLDWQPGMDNSPPFPSGKVMHERTVSASCSYDAGKGSYITAGGGMRFRSGGRENLDSEDGFAWFEVVLDL
jgi:hypothetical protein